MRLNVLKIALYPPPKKTNTTKGKNNEIRNEMPPCRL